MRWIGKGSRRQESPPVATTETSQPERAASGKPLPTSEEIDWAHQQTTDIVHRARNLGIEIQAMFRHAPATEQAPRAPSEGKNGPST